MLYDTHYEEEVEGSRSDRQDPPHVTRMIDGALLHFSSVPDAALVEPQDDEYCENLENIQSSIAGRIQGAKDRRHQHELTEYSVGTLDAAGQTCTEEETHYHTSFIQEAGSPMTRPVVDEDGVGNSYREQRLARDDDGIASEHEERYHFGPDAASTSPDSQTPSCAAPESSAAQGSLLTNPKEAREGEDDITSR